MKLYRSPSGEIFGYEPDGSQDYLIPTDYVQLTDAEVAAREQEFAIIDVKGKAKSLLFASDWAVLPDVELQNKQEFVDYRKVLRGLVINPVSDAVFPPEPAPIWM